jgi:tetratricopeptide (TPR) repeat protein
MLALEGQREVGNRYGEAATLSNLGSIHRRANNLAAIDSDTTSLRLYREIGDSRGQAHALNNLGINHSLAGEPAQAIELLRQALELHRDVGDRYGQAQALFNLGRVHATTDRDNEQTANY